MEKDNKKPLKFLSNEPIGSDLFAGKSQEKTAEVISQILKDEKFQIIGIDGSWGTGKSNLVKIVENKLKTYKFFIYDVWGHQEDDQRRSILIELTDFILDKNIKLIDNDKKWKENLKKLLGKEKEITTINRPYLSIGFIFSLFSIIYIPTVNTFKDSIEDFLEIDSLIWKLILVLFPIFIVFGIYLFNLISNWSKKRGFWYSFKLAAQQTFQVYTNKQEQETKVETISENEPSVRDFTEWMKSIDNDLKSNKLVIVFDNFDRLPKKQILSIWSSLHVLFSDKKYKNVKVIVPFDREHIKNAFSEMNGKGDKDYADDYINKTFDLVYRVSPPILSDWKDFFRSKWTEAVKKFDEKEYLRVIQAYEVYRPQITPREIIAFINEIVSIKLLNDEIPDQYTALFVLHKAHILKDPLKSITNPEEYLEGLTYLYEDDEDFQKYITALAYQISSENSLEVIYKKQLKNALINGDEAKFSEIAKTNIFPVIIRTTLRDGIEDFSKPIEVLYTLEPSEKISKYLIQEIWDDIFNKLKTLEIKHLELTRAQGLLFEKISNNQKIKWAKKLLADYSSVEDFDSVKYASIVEDLKEHTKINQEEWDLFQNLPAIKVKVSQIINLVQAYPNRYQSFRISCDQKELNEYFINKKDAELKEIDRLEYLKLEYDLSDFQELLIEKVDKNTNNPKILGELIRLLKNLSNSKLPITIPDDAIYSMFSGLNKESDFYYDLLAMRLARGNNFPSNYTPSFAAITQSTDPEVVEKIKNCILYFSEYDDLLLNSVAFNSSELFKSVIRKLVPHESELKRADVNEILKRFDEICSSNNIEPILFLSDLNDFEYDIERLDFSSFSLGFYQLSKDSNFQICKVCKSGLEEFFEKYTKEKWRIVFKDSTSNSFLLLKSINYSKWNSFATEAFEELLSEVVSSGKIINKDSISYLLGSFEIGNKPLVKIFKTLRDELINSSRINPSTFSLLGNWLFKYGNLKERASDVLRAIFKPSLLDDNDCLKVFLENSKELKNLTHISSESERQAFEESIRIRSNNDHIRQLANNLEIELSSNI